MNNNPASTALPLPDADALAHSRRTVAHIREAIAAQGGWISFASYMELALYAPGLGYYSAGARKLGADGDFVTAPELSPLFGQTLARQVAQVLQGGTDGRLDAVLEIGAGSGALAATLLEELERLEALPDRYLILELSADLRERSRDRLAAQVPHLLERVAWLNQLPPSFRGVILGNEVLDAMPVHLVHQHGQLDETGVVASAADSPDAIVAGAFAFAARPAQGALRQVAAALSLPDDFHGEIDLAAQAFLRSVGACLENGVALFIDYGFPAHEFYHQQRREGTLMCHYRHRAHLDPFLLPGLQDITAHVNFSAIAGAAIEAGLELAGYATQAQFLVNCGITDVMLRISPEDPARYLPLSNAANRLLSPAEMGELFKVIAFSKNRPAPLLGFARGDRRHSL